MARGNRDEFLLNTKKKLELRAGGLCSFRDCRTLTSGPSAESSSSSSNSGRAAHIHAAAPGPGARRYLETMTPEQRSHIDNGIWLCATHAALIDEDEETYTADILREMKRKHEAFIKDAHETRIRLDFAANGHKGDDFILFKLWRTQIDLPSLAWHTKIRPDQDFDIIISDDFINRTISLLEEIDQFLSHSSPSNTMRWAMEQFIRVLRDFVELIDEADCGMRESKFCRLFSIEQAKGNFLYLVNTERENPWGLSAGDQVEFEKNVLRQVMSCIIFTANGVIHAANGVELFKEPHDYIWLNQKAPYIPDPPYPGLKDIRQELLTHYQEAE